MEAAKLAIFQNLERQKIKNCVMFAKTLGWSRNWGAWSKTGGLCPPRLEPKTATVSPLVLGFFWTIKLSFYRTSPISSLIHHDIVRCINIYLVDCVICGRCLLNAVVGTLAELSDDNEETCLSELGGVYYKAEQERPKILQRVVIVILSPGVIRFYAQ